MEAQFASEEAEEELAEAEEEIARLKAMLMRLEGSQNIFTADKLLVFDDIKICEDDQGLEQSNKRAPLGMVIRRSGHWRGAIVTVEVIELPQLGHDESSTSGSTAMQRRLQLAAQAKRQRRWEAAARQELHVLGRLRHPGLIEYYGAAFSGTELLLVSESPLVSLAERLSEGPKLKNDDRLDIAMDLMHALEYLHVKGVSHRHITEDNVFLKDLPHIVVKLGGVFPARLTCRATGEFFVPSSYQPPARQNSVLVPTQDESVDPRKVDIFAYGALLMHLYSGHRPDPGKALRSMLQIVDTIENKSLQMVVMKCMEKDPAHRPSARMVLRALSAVQDGDVAGMEAVSDDPSSQSPLAESTYIFDDEELGL